MDEISLKGGRLGFGSLEINNTNVIKEHGFTLSNPNNKPKNKQKERNTLFMIGLVLLRYSDAHLSVFYSFPTGGNWPFVPLHLLCLFGVSHVGTTKGTQRGVESLTDLTFLSEETGFLETRRLKSLRDRSRRV